MTTITITPVEGDTFGNMTPEEMFDWIRNEFDNAGIQARIDLHTGPRKVYVALYELVVGIDVGVFSSAAGAQAWKIAIAKEWWCRETGEESLPDMPDDELAEEYFRRVEGEYFTVTEEEVQP